MLSDETRDPTWETIHLSYEGNGNGHSGHLVKIQAGRVVSGSAEEHNPGALLMWLPAATWGAQLAELPMAGLAAVSHLPLCFVDTLEH